MKSIINRSVLTSLVIFLSLLLNSCDEGFQELNTQPESSNTLSSEYLLSYIWAGGHRDRFTEWRANLIICSSWAQHFSSLFAYDSYNPTEDEYTGAYLDRLTPEFMPEAQDMINRNQGDAIGGMALIFKVHFMMRLADMHGEIAYTQAFQPDVYLTPQYDALPDIYNAFIDDLRTAVEWIENGQGIQPGSFDPLYGGDLEKWRRFGNSMLLRVGLRLSEINEELSESIVAEALSAGVMESNEDIAWISYSGAQSSGIYVNGVSEVFIDFDIQSSGFAYSNTFVDFIQDNNDPRITNLMRTYDATVEENVVSDGTSGFVGLPNGTFSDQTLADYAQPRLDVMVAANSPVLIMTFAEVEFNRAEAIHRGWVAGDPKAAYESGVRAAMGQFELFPNADEISDDAIDAYLAQPSINYDNNDPLVAINTQKWVALLLNGYEAYANYRRLDIPALEPVDEEFRAPQSDGTVPKRVIYPLSEVQNNVESYSRSLERQGPDEINTRLWWDVN